MHVSQALITEALGESAPDYDVDGIEDALTERGIAVDCDEFWTVAAQYKQND